MGWLVYYAMMGGGTSVTLVYGSGWSQVGQIFVAGNAAGELFVAGAQFGQIFVAGNAAGQIEDS